MNITKYRDRLIHVIDPLAQAFARAGLTPNQITFISLLFGIASALLYAYAARLPRCRRIAALRAV